MFILSAAMMALSLLLIIINLLVSKKSVNDREKMSPFECGFDPKNVARLPFSLRFYLIAMIFLIFDVEIALILPIPLMFKITPMYTMMWLTTFFIVILVLGLFHEWNMGALNWDL